MTNDVADLISRQPPRKRTGSASITDVTLLVRVAGQPAAIRVFTDDEQDEAERYASEIGGEVVPLPLAPPPGYTAGAEGFLVPGRSPRDATAP